MWYQFILISLAFATTNCDLTYEDHLTYKVFINTEEGLKHLTDFYQINFDKFDFWDEPRELGQDFDIVVAPWDKTAFEDTIKHKGVSSFLEYFNRIKDEYEVSKRKSPVGCMTWDKYYNLDHIFTWLNDLVEIYPESASLFEAGTSLEGRDFIGIKISKGSSTYKKIIVVECGIHAREWIAVATCTYLVNELLTSNEETMQELAKEFDWYIIPSVNPDGYEYSFSFERLWRKNRRLLYDGEYGIDLNRNWDSHWSNEGYLNDTAGQFFSGAYAFSEPETKTLADFITPLADKIELYISFHSFSQMLLLPYGYTKERIANYDDEKKIGDKGAEALSKRYGTKYTVGSTYEIIYEATGTSVDYVKSHLKIPLVYTFEVRDIVDYGFTLPKNQIIPNCLEIMDALKAMIEESKTLGYFGAKRKEYEMK